MMNQRGNVLSPKCHQRSVPTNRLEGDEKNRCYNIHGFDFTLLQGGVRNGLSFCKQDFVVLLYYVNELHYHHGHLRRSVKENTEQSISLQLYLASHTVIIQLRTAGEL